MLELVNAAHLVVWIALLALAGQFVLGWLVGAGRDRNPVYRLLEVIASPFVKLVRLITPRVFEAVLADYPNVKVQWVPTEHSAAKVQTQMEDLLTANPEKGSIAGVWGAYDLLVSGATEAVRRSGRDEIKIASIDGDRIGFQMLLDEGSPFVATIVQDVPTIGKLAAENIAAAIGGKKEFPSAIFTEVYVATHNNGVAAAEKRWGEGFWEDSAISKDDVAKRWPQDAPVVVVRPVLP